MENLTAGVKSNRGDGKRIYRDHREAEAAVETAYRSLSESRRETGRLQRLYNLAKQRRDKARGKWLDLADTMDVRERIGLDADYFRALRVKEQASQNPDVLQWQVEAQKRGREQQQAEANREMVHVDRPADNPR
jgi:hypothetical protein